MKKHEKDGWHVYSEDGSKHLGGPYATEAEADKRLAEVEAFKNDAPSMRAEPPPPAVIPAPQRATRAFSLGEPDVYNRSVPVIASTTNPVEGDALESWDLGRFQKNPVMLFGHDSNEIPIATAHDVMMTPEGLTMRAQFPKEGEDPNADRVWKAIVSKRMRGVSVGYEPGPARKEMRDGKEITVRSANKLLEVSFVPIPADEDAGTSAIVEPPETEESRRAKVSAAARALALSKKRSDAGENEEQRYDFFRVDARRMDKMKKTPVGGRFIPARLSRIGILEYRNMDGSVRRELRLPEEIFKADSLATLQGVPVIDIKNHNDLVTPETWKDVALGHVENVRRDSDRFIAGELAVNDSDALGQIERGERTDVSCGYLCHLDATPGVWNGQPYDVVQRNIRYNHLALCPPNRGRAGPEVGLRLDAKTAAHAAFNVSTDDGGEDKDTNIMTVKVRLDGKDYDFGSESHVAKLEDMHKGEVARLDAAHKEVVSGLKTQVTDLAKKGDETAAAHKKQVDELTANFDAASARAKKAEDEAVETKKKAKEEQSAFEKMHRGLARTRLRLQRLYREFVGKDDKDKDEDEFDGDDDKDEEEDKKLDAMSDRELKVAILKADSKDFDETGKSEDYVNVYFDRFKADLKKTKAEARARGGVDSIVRQAQQFTADAVGAETGFEAFQKANEAQQKAAREAHIVKR